MTKVALPTGNSESQPSFHHVKLDIVSHFTYFDIDRKALDSSHLWLANTEVLQKPLSLLFHVLWRSIISWVRHTN